MTSKKGLRGRLLNRGCPLNTGFTVLGLRNVKLGVFFYQTSDLPRRLRHVKGKPGSAQAIFGCQGISRI